MTKTSLRRVISYGGSYQEKWDDHYRLRIHYIGQEQLELHFVEGKWMPISGTFPDLQVSEKFFQHAANAAIAAEQFLASGQTALLISNLSPVPCTGAVFAAECLRILMDQHGLSLEAVYPYIALAWEEDLTVSEFRQLEQLQPRTYRLIELLRDKIQRIPAVFHDCRLCQFRCPSGAVETGTTVHLSLMIPNFPVEKVQLEVYGDNFRRVISMGIEQEGWGAEFSAPDFPVALWYRFELSFMSSKLYAGCSVDGVHPALSDTPSEGFRLTVYQSGFETPKWFQQAVLYQVFPDRFAFSDDDTAKRGIDYHKKLGQNPELHQSIQEEVRWLPRNTEKDYIPDDFYGGTLTGIRAKLPELKRLGISCIYLNPIFEARSNHRYDTSDYLKIDPILGDLLDFKLLCRDAGTYGIHVLCDGVFSHTGADSIYFNRDGHYPNPGACQREASPFDSWYHFRHFPDDYRSWWGFRELPEVEETDPAWQDYVVTGKESVMRYWLKNGASGWRLDVADELPDSVLHLMRSVVKSENKDHVLLGEVWEDAVIKESYGSRRNYALGNALDSVMNYPFRTEVLEFLHGKSSAFSLAAFLISQQMNYPKPFYLCLMNLLGSHDVERLRTALATDTVLKDLSREEQLAEEKMISHDDWVLGGKLERLAYVIAFSIPGVPSIYYGDEYGMTGTNDPFNRRPLGIKGIDDLRDFISMLSSRRTTHEALLSGDAFFLACDPDVLLILRKSEKQSVLTVINRAKEKRSYHLCLGGASVSGEVAALEWDSVLLSLDQKN